MRFTAWKPTFQQTGFEVTTICFALLMTSYLINSTDPTLQRCFYATINDYNHTTDHYLLPNISNNRRLSIGNK